MEPEEQIYINLEELGDYKRKHHGPEATETKPVRMDAVAREETESWLPLRVATVCLGLLCFLLLTALVGVGVLYNRDFNQLSRDLANHTAEKQQLLVRYQNLTDERERLQTSFSSTLLELNKVKENMGTCPGGWKLFGCSCYLLSPTRSTWGYSRQACLNHGADLVIINSREEMVFLNTLGAHLKFWIGLSQSSTQSTWRWTDERPLGTA
ncbi:C-type lectin domain family 6 member A-like [Pagrus major]|uniref:C-type lectin domain family 6 member A-like n=1 Tax=Pagrus major TaxID=143350 RepID=UPI003CC887A9